MFGKISKLALGISLIEGVMSGICSTLETLSPHMVHSPGILLQPIPQVSPYAHSASNDKDTYILEIPKGSIKSQDITNILDMLIKNPLALDKFKQLFTQPTHSQSSGNDYEEKGMTSSSDPDLDTVSEDVLYMSLESAWTDLNDFTKSSNTSDRDSAISSLIAYVENGGNTTLPVYKRLLGRICYEHGGALSPERKKLLALGNSENLEQYGINLLKQVSAEDSDAEDYLFINGL